MVDILASIIGALTAGALAKTGDVGGRVVSDAYDGFRALVISKLGRSGAVQSLEEERGSEAAQAVLAEALAKHGLAADQELAERAALLRAAIARAEPGEGGIEVGDITAKLKVRLRDWITSGRIKVGNIISDSSVELIGLTATTKKG